MNQRLVSWNENGRFHLYLSVEILRRCPTILPWVDVSAPLAVPPAANPFAPWFALPSVPHLAAPGSHGALRLAGPAETDRNGKLGMNLLAAARGKPQAIVAGKVFGSHGTHLVDTR